MKAGTSSDMTCSGGLVMKAGTSSDMASSRLAINSSCNTGARSGYDKCTVTASVQVQAQDHVEFTGHDTGIDCSIPTS